MIHHGDVSLGAFRYERETQYKQASKEGRGGGCSKTQLATGKVLSIHYVKWRIRLVSLSVWPPIYPNNLTLSANATARPPADTHPGGPRQIAINYDISWLQGAPLRELTQARLLNTQQLPLFTTEGSRFAWQLPGGQLHRPDERRWLDVWDLSVQTAISTVSYYIPSTSFSPLPSPLPPRYLAVVY